MPRFAALLLTVLAATILVACGGTSSKKDATQGSLPSSGELRDQLQRATASTAADFPAVGGRTLQQVADGLDGAGPQVALATSVFTPGVNRLAFGVIDKKSGFVYGKTAVYVAASADKVARGPYAAPADLLITDPPFRSRTAANQEDFFAAVYQAKVPLERPGKMEVLVVTKFKGGQLVGAPSVINVVPASKDTVVRVGARAPRVETDTVDSAGGNVRMIDTRVPADDMHDIDFADALGKKPVGLIFATPQLCESRVCGPVVDVTMQLKQVYGDRMTFIHQEVYKDNDPSQGYRDPLEQFGLRTEPWFFAIDSSGTVTARLEGSFGFDAIKGAVETALR